MTLFEFGKRAIEIGCRGSMVAVSAEIHRHGNGDTETNYSCYCGRQEHKNRGTGEYPTPEEALREFERMHDIKQESADMQITEPEYTLKKLV